MSGTTEYEPLLNNPHILWILGTVIIIAIIILVVVFSLDKSKAKGREQ